MLSILDNAMLHRRMYSLIILFGSIVLVRYHFCDEDSVDNHKLVFDVEHHRALVVHNGKCLCLRMNQFDRPFAAVGKRVGSVCQRIELAHDTVFVAQGAFKGSNGCDI